MMAYILMIVMLSMLVYLNRNHELAFSNQCISIRKQEDEDMASDRANLIYEEKSGGNPYYNGENTYGPTAQNYDPVGGIDIAAEERGYHRAPNGNELAAKTLVSTIGVDGRNSTTAGVDQCNAAYLGAERTFDAYGGYANVGTSTVQHQRVLYSQTITEEMERRMDESCAKLERERNRTLLQKIGDLAIGYALLFGIIFGVWAIFHFIF
ncbi:hypothetical protein [Ruminococcus sp. XPD3002]|uniref:hypothetical protein n=1 Tax=Ruminococcus sp. XPD3002 TaxID=1452269 RepID=UPI000911ECA9|nr:hypothetical protein SAMN04487832_11312 [Ruminococcus flavefaciens]